MMLDVDVFEPDVSPLAVQGPKAQDLMIDLVGERIKDIKFFWFIETTMAGAPVVIARSGWSGQGGFEIYLQDSSAGLTLWDLVFEAGKKYNIRAGCPNQIERMETGLLSYGSDMTLENNPLECGLEKYCQLDKTADYFGREALHKVRHHGPKQKLVKLFSSTNQLLPLRSTWPVFNDDDNLVGFVTSQAHSKRFGGLLMFAYIQTLELSRSSSFVLKIDNQLFQATVRKDDWSSM